MMWPFKKTTNNTIELNVPKALAPEGLLLIGHKGISKNPAFLRDEDLACDAIMTGQAGSGKTSLNLLLAYQQIQRGGGIAFIHGKCDIVTLETLWEFACLCGRERDLLVLRPDRPELTNSYNPVLNGTPEQISDRCMLLMPAGGSPGRDFCRNEARLHLVRVVSCLRAAGLAFNMLDLAILSSHEQALRELIQKAEEASPTSPSIAALRQWLMNVPGGNIRALLGGLAGRLSQLGMGRMASTSESYEPEIDLASAILHNKIVYIGLPTMGKSDYARSFGKLLIADLQAAYDSTKALPPEQQPKVPFLRVIEDSGLFVESRGGVVQSLRHGISDAVTAIDGTLAPRVRIAFKPVSTDNAIADAGMLGLDHTACIDQIRRLKVGQFVLKVGRAGETTTAQTPLLSIPTEIRESFGKPKLNSAPRRGDAGAALHLDVQRYLMKALDKTDCDDAGRVPVETN